MDIDVLFLGAGASTPFGIPTMRGMATEFEETLKPSAERELYGLIKGKLKNYNYFDLESLITVLQHILEPDQVVNDILNDPSIHFFVDHVGLSWETAKGNVDFLANTNQEKARSLLRALKEYLRQACTVALKDEDLKLYDWLFGVTLRNRVENFAKYVKQEGPKSLQLSIFTTNYDLILEQYCVSRQLAYNNGEKGRDLYISKEENPDLLSYPGIGSFRIRKLHGSINWYRDAKGNLKCSDRPVTLGETSLYGDEIVEELLLYPIRGLYAYREPFYDLFLDLKITLEKARNWLVIGYSFRDKDIAGLFLDASEKNPHLTVYLIGLGDDTVSEVQNERLKGFKGRVYASKAKFNHEDIDELLAFLQLSS